MGREIRRVPNDWQHPTYTEPGEGGVVGKFRPLFDATFTSAAESWLSELDLWRQGNHPDQSDPIIRAHYQYYWQWAGSPPDPDYYRSRAWTADEAVCYQMYETVTEGTPVSPVFRTKAELRDYLIEHGDYSDQRRGGGGWNRESAERFIEAAWAPSGIGLPGLGILAPRNQ